MNATVRNFGWIIVGLLSALLLVIVLALLVGTGSSSQDAEENTEAIEQTQRDNRELLRLIKSCTTPGEECFQEGQERTADAIADINRVTVYAASCADKPGVQGQAEIYACVVELLAEDDADGQGG